MFRCSSRVTRSTTLVGLPQIHFIKEHVNASCSGTPLTKVSKPKKYTIRLQIPIHLKETKGYTFNKVRKKCTGPAFYIVYWEGVVDSNFKVRDLNSKYICPFWSNLDPFFQTTWLLLIILTVEFWKTYFLLICTGMWKMQYTKASYSTNHVFPSLKWLWKNI